MEVLSTFRLKSTTAKLVGLVFFASCALVQFQMMAHLDWQQLPLSSLAISDHLLGASSSTNTTFIPSCAVNLYGLPRAFKSLVLPSLIKNVISVNPSCDYYMHFFHQRVEGQTRSGTGGKLDSAETITALFQEAVKSINPRAAVHIYFDTEATYKQKLAAMNIQELGNQMFLRKSELERNESVDLKTLPDVFYNILKMWSSQESVWNLMKQRGNQSYEYVAMLRNDVFYASPVNILDRHGAPGRPKVAIPAFGKMPLSDRMIYGPHDAVEIWAMNRSDLANNDTRPPLGRGGDRWKDGKLDMSSDEIYMQRFIIPRMEERGFEIVEHPSVCFFRARAEETVWVSDCFHYASPSVKSYMLGVAKKDLPKESKSFALNASQQMRPLVEGILGRPCGKIRPVKLRNDFFALFCPSKMRRKSALQRVWRSFIRRMRKWTGL